MFETSRDNCASCWIACNCHSSSSYSLFSVVSNGALHDTDIGAARHVNRCNALCVVAACMCIKICAYGSLMIEFLKWSVRPLAIGLHQLTISFVEALMQRVNTMHDSSSRGWLLAVTAEVCTTR